MTVDLGRFHLFEGVSDSTKKRILSEAGNRVDLEKGERLCRAGSEPGGLILILKGKAEVLKGSVILQSLKAGDVTGVSTLFGEKAVMETDVTAKTRLTALRVPKETVREALHTDPVFAENYIRFLSSRIRFLNEAISRLAGADSGKRMSAYLLAQAKLQGNGFLLNATRAAKTLNMSRASLYRTLSDLEQEGFLERRDRRICIKDERVLNQENKEGETR